MKWELVSNKMIVQKSDNRSSHVLIAKINQNLVSFKKNTEIIVIAPQMLEMLKEILTLDVLDKSRKAEILNLIKNVK